MKFCSHKASRCFLFIISDSQSTKDPFPLGKFDDVQNIWFSSIVL